MTPKTPAGNHLAPFIGNQTSSNQKQKKGGKSAFKTQLFDFGQTGNSVETVCLETVKNRYSEVPGPDVGRATPRPPSRLLEASRPGCGATVCPSLAPVRNKAAGFTGT